MSQRRIVLLGAPWYNALVKGRWVALFWVVLALGATAWWSFSTMGEPAPPPGPIVFTRQAPVPVPPLEKSAFIAAPSALPAALRPATSPEPSAATASAVGLAVTKHRAALDECFHGWSSTAELPGWVTLSITVEGGRATHVRAAGIDTPFFAGCVENVLSAEVLADTPEPHVVSFIYRFVPSRGTDAGVLENSPSPSPK